MVELHFSPCFLLTVVSFVILCGNVDDCSEGSVMTVLCGSVSDIRIFDENVICVGRGIVDNMLDHFILNVPT